MKIQDIKTRWYTFAEYINAHNFTAGVEIGVAYGEYCSFLLKHCPNLHMNLVDPWVTQSASDYHDPTGKIDFDGALAHCKKLLKPYEGRYSIVRKFSNDAAELFAEPSVDFVYIDGVHHNPQFAQDLDLWFPKVVSNGVFCGHDYYDVKNSEYTCEVKSTVDKWANDRGLVIHSTVVNCPHDWQQHDASWWIQVP